MYWVASSHVPSNDPAMIRIWGAVTSACLSAVVWLHRIRMVDGPGGRAIIRGLAGMSLCGSPHGKHSSMQRARTVGALAPHPVSLGKTDANP